mgnify:CR=1 FL=1
MKFTLESVERFCKKALIYVGIPEADAAQAAEVVTQADHSGVLSHGLQRLPMYLARIHDGAVNRQPSLRQQSGNSLCMAFDGDNGLGIVNGPKVMEQVIKMAKENGIAAATLKNSNHYGAGNYYGWKAASKGVIGLCMTNTSPCMAPTGSSESLLGTNPLTAAFPAGKHDPVVLDMATSIASYGKLQVMAGKGETIPEGWALDAEGNPTTDPAAGLKGTLLPIGGYKGYGLALIIDLFCAVLSGACYGNQIGRLGIPGSTEPEGIGQFFLAIDPARFLPFEEFQNRIDDYIEMIKNARRAPGVTRIWLPGEIEFEKSRTIEKEGVEVPPATEARLLTTCRSLGMIPEDGTLTQLIMGN